MGLLDNAKDKILQETVQELTRLKSEIQNMTAQSIKNAKAQINTEVISKIKTRILHNDNYSIYWGFIFDGVRAFIR